MIALLASAAVLSCMNPRIVDGDTLVCGGESVRLAAINAREKNNSCRRGSPCTRTSGQAATAQLRSLTAGRRVLCTPQATDRYGRTVARCSVAGTAAPGIRGQQVDLSCAMVRSGHAAEWRQYGRACR